MKSVHTNSILNISILVALLTSLLGSALTVLPASAASAILVNSNSDTVADDGFCTLREAITSANGDFQVYGTHGECTAGMGADTITLPADTYTLTIGGTGEDSNSTGDLDITADLTINGAVSGAAVIRAHATPGSGIDRVFQVYGGITVKISDVMIMNGICPSTCAGGGIYNQGSLTVTNSTFSGNSADWGGAIYHQGTLLEVTNSTFYENSAYEGGGIYNDFGTVTVTNSTFYNNSATLNGGGIFTTDGLIITNSTVSGNSAQFGGGIYNQGGLHLKNTILANSTSGVDCYNNAGTIVTNINNLIETNGVGANACGTPAMSTDPSLGSLEYNGGPTLTFALPSGSPAIDAGNDTVCAAMPVNNTSQNEVTRPQGIHCDIGSFEKAVTILTSTLRSAGAYDGWVLESFETSNFGGSMNSTATVFNLGDDNLDRQYKAILHFNTAGLPDNAVITRVVLKIRKQGLVGTNPFSILGKLRVDMSKPFLGSAIGLATSDLQVVAGKSAVSTFQITPINNWYIAILNSTGRTYLNKTGTTQFRLYFAKDDNDDMGADYMKFFSGNYATATSRPTLVVEYYVP